MRFFLNSVEVTPRGYEKISITENKESLETKIGINTESLEFENEGKDVILSWLQQYGYFQGIPLKIILENGFQLDYFVDTANGLRIQDDKIIASIRKERDNQEFFEKADGLTFDALASLGVSYSTVNVPYIVKPKDIEVQLLILSFASYQIISAIQDTISEAAKVAASISSGATGIIYAASLSVILLAKLTALIVALANLIKRIKDIVYPPVSTYKAISYKELIVKSLSYMGFQLSSSLVDGLANVFYQGIPLNSTSTSFFDSLFPAFSTSFTRGYPTFTDAYPGMIEDFTTVGGFIRMIARVYNARVVVKGQIVYIERRDKKFNVTTGVKTALTIQDTRVTEYSANTNEVWRTALIKYPIDPNDVYTQEDFDSRVTEYQTQNINTLSTQRDLIKGLKIVDLPFAGAKRRKDLDVIDKFIKSDIGYYINQFISNVSSVTNSSYSFVGFDSLFNPPKRVGVAVYSERFYTIPKMLYLVGGKQPENYKDFISTDAIWNNYHNIDFIGNNSFIIKTGELTECNPDLFVNLLNSDFAEINGVVCEVLTLEYNEFDRLLSISYKEPSNYANTVKLVKL